MTTNYFNEGTVDFESQEVNLPDVADAIHQRGGANEWIVHRAWAKRLAAYLHHVPHLGAFLRQQARPKGQARNSIVFRLLPP